MNLVEKLFDMEMECPHCKGSGRVPDPRKTGAWQRERRVKSGLSLRKAASLMGISAPYLSDMELGRRVFTPKMINKLNQVLGGGKMVHSL